MHKKLCWIWMYKTFSPPSQRAFFNIFFYVSFMLLYVKNFIISSSFFKFFCFFSWLFFSSHIIQKHEEWKNFCDMQAQKNMQAWIYIIMAHLWIKWLQNVISIKFTLNCMFIVVLYCMKMGFFFATQRSAVMTLRASSSKM